MYKVEVKNYGTEIPAKNLLYGDLNVFTVNLGKNKFFGVQDFLFNSQKKG